MDIAQAITAAVGVGGVVAAVLAYFKRKPGQRERDDVTIAEGTINVAQGTIHLVTTTLEAQFVRMDAEMQAMQVEHDEFKRLTDARLAELATELRAERAEKVEVKRENAILIQRLAKAESRVTELEAEVGRLKELRG